MRRLLPGLVLLLSVIGSIADVRAEEAAPEEAPAPEPELSAEEVALARSRVHFDHGLRLTRRSLWQAALVEFEESLRLYPTAVAAYNRALCLRRLYRYPETIAALEEYLERYPAEIDAERRTVVENLLSEIRALLTEVTVQVSHPGATIVVDGEEAGTSPLARPLLLLSGPHELVVQLDGHRRVRRDVVVVSGRGVTEAFELEEEASLGRLRVEANVDDAVVIVDGNQVGAVPYLGVLPAGDHRVEVSATGYQPVLQTVSITAGEDRIATMTLSQRTRAHRAWFWSAAGLGVGSFLAMIGLGTTAYILHSDYDPAAADAQERYDQGRSYVVATDVMLGVACVSAAAAFILAFFTEWGRDRRRAAPSRARGGWSRGTNAQSLH